MGGRRRGGRKGIKQRQPGTASHPLMRYEQTKWTLNMGTSSVGDDFGTTLFDTSSRTGNKNSKIGKMTIQWFANLNQAGTLYYHGIYKAKEGATLESLDAVASIRDMRSEGRLVRGPWMTQARGVGHGLANIMTPMKTIVLEDLLLDPNDDLIFGHTTAGVATSGTNDYQGLTRDFWKVTE